MMTKRRYVSYVYTLKHQSQQKSSDFVVRAATLTNGMDPDQTAVI